MKLGLQLPDRALCQHLPDIAGTVREPADGSPRTEPEDGTEICPCPTEYLLRFGQYSPRELGITWL
jgi:hypothetical protein